MHTMLKLELRLVSGLSTYPERNYITLHALGHEDVLFSASNHRAMTIVSFSSCESCFSFIVRLFSHWYLQV